MSTAISNLARCLPAPLRSRFSGASPRLRDPEQAFVYGQAHAIAHCVLKGTVDDDLFKEQVVLCEETQRFLYAPSTMRLPLPEPGARPALEAIVRKLVRKRHSPLKKVLALLAFARDIPRLHPWGGPQTHSIAFGDPSEGVPRFYGGTEEEIIKKGATLCNEQARVMIILCQLAGFPARYVGTFTPMYFGPPRPAGANGHATVEVWLDGAWRYLDIRGHHYLKRDGTLANTWELRRDPEIILRQGADLKKFLAPGYGIDHTKWYLTAHSVTAISNYLAVEHARHCYRWIWDVKEWEPPNATYCVWGPLSRRYREKGRTLYRAFLKRQGMTHREFRNRYFDSIEKWLVPGNRVRKQRTTEP